MKKGNKYVFICMMNIFLITWFIGGCKVEAGEKIHDYSIAWIKDGQTQYGVGANRDASEVMFEAGSNGKVIAAYLCLMLSNQKLFSLDDPIVNYLEEDWISEDARFQKITIRELLSHTAGFSPNFEIGMDRKLYFEPGSKFSYSGVGYIYLQKVMENVTGDSYEHLVQKYVFQPLHMKHSTFTSISTVTPYLKTSSFALYTMGTLLILCCMITIILGILGHCTHCQIYRKKQIIYLGYGISSILLLIVIYLYLSRLMLPAIVVEAVGFFILLLTRKINKRRFLIIPAYLLIGILLCSFMDTTLPIGIQIRKDEPNCAYSLITCTKDMTLFANELLNQYHKDNTFHELFQPQVHIDDRNSWGAGLAIEATDKGITYWHSGINPGMQSLLVLCPEQNEAMIVMTNSDYGYEYAKEQVQDILHIQGTWEIPRIKIN